MSPSVPQQYPCCLTRPASAQSAGQVEMAVEHFEQALAIAREIGDRRGEGNHLGNLGLAYRAQGLMEQARELWMQALSIFEEIKSPNTELVRYWLGQYSE